MTTPTTSVRTVVVAGDATFNWTLATAEVSAADSPRVPSARTCCQRGGAALLADLIDAIAQSGGAAGRGPWQVRQAALPRDGVCPSDPRFHHSYLQLDRFQASTGDKARVWRVARFFGLERATVTKPDPAEVDLSRIRDDAPAADLVVLDDAGLGFRDDTEQWPAAITAPKARPWVILTTSPPIATGELWHRLIERHADRLIVVVTVDDLRHCAAQISRGISWERTTEDVARELAHNPRVNGLKRAAHVVVSLGTSGAVLTSRGDASAGASPCTRLIFDPAFIEGEWAGARPGEVTGMTSCLTACLAREAMITDGVPDVVPGVQAGLGAMRRAHEIGFGPAGGSSFDLAPAFPNHVVTERPGQSTFVDVALPAALASAAAAAPPHPWRILESRYASGALPDLNELARRILLDGHGAVLAGVPVGRFGDLVSIDRAEIESLNKLRGLIEEYLRGNEKAPLSIGVFGPPGSGKSFAVKHVAKAILPSKEKPLEFNLTQMSDEQDLPDKFHQVRDRVLGGSVPLVFWDEFDTNLGGQELGWLSRFLGPMADGVFLDGQTSRPIGRAVFVFAGGTASRLAEFDRGRDDKAFVRVKGPDFVRRLGGSLDILGPNRQGQAAAGADPYFIVRRAMILRSSLAQREAGLFSGPTGSGRLSIDRGLLRALLHIPEYNHGASSINAIISASTLTGKNRFDRSCLPPDSEVARHVNHEEFRRLMEQLEPEGELLEKLAEAAHDIYCEGKRRDGWTYGPERDDSKKIHNLLVPYAKLADTYKESNRTTVRNIPRKLAAAGYAMTLATAATAAVTFTADEIERMAKIEHQLWMEDRIAAGFTLGPESGPGKTNPYLVPWEELAEKIRVIDRDLVKGIPMILAKAGYGVVRVG